MASIEVNLNLRVLDEELNTPRGQLWWWLEKRAKKATMAAKRQVGVDTGALRKSIHYRHLRNFTGQYVWIGSNTQRHAYAHHEGTKPHIIKPEAPNTVLVFRKGSRVIATPMVRHPGTRPNRYLSNQLRYFLR